MALLAIVDIRMHVSGVIDVGMAGHAPGPEVRRRGVRSGVVAGDAGGGGKWEMTGSAVTKFRTSVPGSYMRSGRRRRVACKGLVARITSRAAERQVAARAMGVSRIAPLGGMARGLGLAAGFVL